MQVIASAVTVAASAAPGKIPAPAAPASIFAMARLSTCFMVAPAPADAPVQSHILLLLQCF
jgi:hypothetical protein